MVLMTATFLPKAEAAISSSRMALRLRPNDERTSTATMSITSARHASASTRYWAGLSMVKPGKRAGGMLVMPPMPPVTTFHSEKMVTASICKPSEAATKYSPRTLRAGRARASEIRPATPIAAAVESRKPPPSFIATRVAVYAPTPKNTAWAIEKMPA